MEASSIMTRDVVVVSPQLPLEFAWHVMTRRHIRHLPVADEGELVGILSDRDILRWSERQSDGEMKVPDLRVRDAMIAPVITCGREATVAQLARKMIQRKIDALPVVDRGRRLLGLVTSVDLLQLLTDGSESRRLPMDFRLLTLTQQRALEPLATREGDRETKVGQWATSP